MTDAIPVPLHVPEAEAAPDRSLDRGTPCTMVILGASGDLTRRKLMPALFHLMKEDLLSNQFNIIGVSRGDMTDREFRDAVRRALEEFSREEVAGSSVWDRFSRRLEYIGGDLAHEETRVKLKERLDALEHDNDSAESSPRGRLFYLALPPSAFEPALVHLAESGLAPRTDAVDQGTVHRGWVRIIIEKPFGDSLEGAHRLNEIIRARYVEDQIFRIDHYLAKETVQNLLVFRFANSIFEPVWNRDHIHHVQITAAESVGVEHRSGYYEHAGVIRDMFQNHLLQLLALTAMEPPTAFHADDVRTEKIKVLNAIRPIPADEISRYVVAGQYGEGTGDGSSEGTGDGSGEGTSDGRRVPGYRQEDGVDADSTTPTYAAASFLVDNWRWQGVPFFLRSGKRMPRRTTEIAIRFRRPPHQMFPLAPGQELRPNVLAFRIQPDDGISLCFEVKVPDHDFRMATASMDFAYATEFGASSHSAYETLLVDCMLGDATLFTRSDGAEAAWRIVDPIIAALDASSARPAEYPAGSWGPSEADALVGRAGAEWRAP